MPTVQERAQIETVPLCIYCNSRMIPAVTDRVIPNKSYRQFLCKDCGWEVKVPLCAET